MSLSGVERHLDTWHQACGVTLGMVLGRPEAALHGPCGTLPAQPHSVVLVPQEGTCPHPTLPGQVRGIFLMGYTKAVPEYQSWCLQQLLCTKTHQ